MQPDLEPLRGVRGGIGLGQGRAGEDVGAAADALPAADIATGGTGRDVLLEAPCRTPVAVIVAGHDHDGLEPPREVPEPRQRLLVRGDVGDQVGQQPLLLVGLRNRDHRPVDPVGLGVVARAAEEQVIWADGPCAVPLLARPCGVALSRVGDRPRQVIGEGGGATAVRADAAHGHRRRCERGRRVRVQVGDARGPVERVPVGHAVELHRPRDDARARRPRGVDLQVSVGDRRPRGREPEQARELGVGPHRDQRAAGPDPPAQHPDLRRREVDVADDRDVVRGQGRRGHRGDILDGELVEPFGAQDLAVVARERVLRPGDHEDRAARRPGWRGAGRARRLRDESRREEDDGGDEQRREEQTPHTPEHSHNSTLWTH